MFCCFGRSRKNVDISFSNIDHDQVNRGVVFGLEPKCLKRYFQHVRFLNKSISEDPLDAEERQKVVFFVRRHKIKELLEKCSKLKVSEHEDMKHHLDTVENLSVELKGKNMDAIFRSESNQKMLEHKESVLALATFLEASSNFDYEVFETYFTSEYKTTVKDIMGVLDDGEVADWAPAKTRILNSDFDFRDGIAEEEEDSALPDTRPDNLVIFLIPSIEVLKDSFEDYIQRFKTHMPPCLVEDGPTMVFLLTNLTEMKSYCRKKLRADYVGKIEDCTKRIVEFCCGVLEDHGGDISKLKLPLVTFVDLDDIARFKQAMCEIAKLNEEKDPKRQKVLLNDRESFFS